MITLQKLKDMKPGTIFAEGIAMDSPGGLFMANTGKVLRWIAVRGGIYDWAIYCHFADKSTEYVKSQGDKVISAKNIKMLVSCSNEAFKMYRY